MDREEYKKVKEIFQSALDVEPAERAAFLDENCSGDKDLRREVKRLLDSFESDYLEQPAIGNIAERVSGSDLAPGQIVGRYKIEERIGKGGMGEVFLAEDTRLKRKIALKVLPAALSFDEDRLRRFEQEACAASALNHPNILTVHEFSAEEGAIYIASEFVKGKTLRERLEGRPLDLAEALDIASQVGAALNAAHESGIVHRDIKPENIMLRDDRLVKVLDFGLAKLTENKNETIDRESDTLEQVDTTPGMVMGTPAYMSPEQARGLPTDTRSDIWSLGVVLYEMTSGRQPFGGETPSDKIASILTGEAPPMDADLPPELDRIIRKALRKDRSKRYKTVKDFLRDLKGIKSDLEFQNKLNDSFEPVDRETKSELYQETAKANARTIDEAPPQHTFQAFSARYSFLFKWAFAALLTAIIGASIWWLGIGRTKQTAATDQTPAGLFKTFQITNWTSAAGEIPTTAAFSPDGKFIAFGSTESGTRSIWVKQAGAGDAIQVTKDEFSNLYPVFSPDGEEIVYYSNREGVEGIWRVSLMGGQPKLIAGSDRRVQPRLWSKSGKIYFQNNFNLFTADATSGAVSAVTDLPSSGNSPNTFDISPDETQLALVVTADEHWKIMVRAIDSAETKQILDSKTPIEHLVWNPDGKRLLFSRQTDEFYQIFSVGLDGGEPVQISFGDSDFFVQDVSPGGERILYSSAIETSDLWNINKEGAAKEALTASRIDGELWADVSPAGDAIVYQSVRNLSQRSNLFNGSIMKQSISKEGEPLQLAENGFFPQWSPDGETVAFLKRVGQDYEIWKVAKTGDLLERIAIGEKQGLGYVLTPYLTTQVKHLSWSPTGSALAFPAKRDGVSNIWLAPKDGSGERKVSDNDDPMQFFYCPVWNSDETGIAFSSRSNKTNASFIWFYDTAAKTQRKILETEDAVRLLGWTKSGEELIFAVKDKSKITSVTPPEVPVRAVSVKTGKVRDLIVLKDAYFYNIYPTPDKTSIGFTSRSGGSDNVWISPLEGGEPRKLTANNDPRLYFSSLAWSPDGKSIYFGKQTRFTLLSMLVNQKTMEERNEKSN